jgi:HK97 family phage major capsid protein
MPEKSYTVKVISQDDETVTVGGYGIVYGGVDLEGESFTKDTDFMPNLVPEKLVLYDHGLQGEVKHVLGKTIKESDDETGIWVEAQLSRHEAYVEEILSLIDEKILGWSSGSVNHLIERDGKHIKRWPVVEYSLTPTPAEPRTLGVERIKMLAQSNPSLEALLPEKSADLTRNATEGEAGANTAERILEVREMADEERIEEQKQPEPEVEVTVKEHEDHFVTDQIKTLTGNVAELSEQITKVMQYMEDTPAIRNSGYFTQDGEEADQGVKSFGDFLKAIHRGDTERLQKVYGSTKAAMAEGAGATGGFLVPEEYLNRLLQVAQDAAVVRPRATVINVGSDFGRIPALNQYTAPTAGAGQSAFAGGVVASWTAEAAALTETEPTFKEIEYKINKMGGYSLISNELIADSAQAVESLLTSLFGRAVAAMEDYAFLRGDGQAKPLGILNWGGLINITPSTNSTFGVEDATAMLARFLPVGGSPGWLMHRGTIPDLANFTVTAGEDLLQPKQPLPTAIFGYPIVYSEHLPQDDNSGNVILADLSAYAIFDRAGMAIAFSEHFKFTNDQGTWRFTKRLDGQPWMTDDITLADPQGSYTVGPFVNHND